MELNNIGDAVVGKKLIAIGRDISKPELVAGSGRHRAQRVSIKGFPARCFIDISIHKL